MTNSAGSPPLLLLNGFWHGSWCWSEVLGHLAASGRIAVPVDLAAHGLYARRPRWSTAEQYDPASVDTEVTPGPAVTLDDAAELLISQIRLVGGGAPVSILAHSAAGIVLTRVVEQVPELVAQAIYLCAFMPASDVDPALYNQIPEASGSGIGPLYRGDPSRTGALRLDLASNDPAYREALRDTLYHDVDPMLAEATIGLLSPDVPVGITLTTTTLTEKGWGSVPHSYIRCTADKGLMPAVQDRFIAEADAAFPDNPTTVASLDSSHSPFLSMPAQLAEAIMKVS